MLVGAFAAIVGSYFGNSALVGVAAAMARGGHLFIDPRLWRDDFPRRPGRHRHRHEPARIGADGVSTAGHLRRQRHLQRSERRRAWPNHDSGARRRAGAWLGVCPPVGADLGGLGADRADQRCSVPYAARTAAARRRRAAGGGGRARRRRRPLPDRRLCSSPGRSRVLRERSFRSARSAFLPRT